MLSLTPHPQGTLIEVRARAGASRNQVVGIEQGALKVSVTQIAEGGKANRAIASEIARWLGCAKSRVVLISGAKSSRKRFLLADFTFDEIRQQSEGL